MQVSLDLRTTFQDDAEARLYARAAEVVLFHPPSKDNCDEWGLVRDWWEAAGRPFLGMAQFVISAPARLFLEVLRHFKHLD